MFAKSIQYSVLLDYCENQGKKVWPVVFNKYLDGEVRNKLLIDDLTIEEYEWVMNDVRRKQNEEARRNNTAPTARTNSVNYIAFLLGELKQGFESEHKSNEVTDILEFEENQAINVYPNPAGSIVHIELTGFQQTEVVIKICDLSGRVLKSVMKKIAGDSIYSINIEDIPDGTYLCKIETDNIVRTTKINVNR